MGFLFSRRWLLFALAVALGTWVAVQLGQWQFDRLTQRRADNAQVGSNIERPPSPLQDVMSPDRPPVAGDEWRRVTVTGTWDERYTIVWKYQTRNGKAGVDVVTPLVTASGSAVLVDRGWMATANSGSTRPDLPAVTGGEVTVTGYVRLDATGGSTRVDELATRAVSSQTIGEVVPYPLVRGFLGLSGQEPKATDGLQAIELPDHTSNGPHFFYGLQWWFFGALAVFGFLYLAFDEFRKRRRGALSEGAQHPAVDRQHHAGHER